MPRIPKPRHRHPTRLEMRQKIEDEEYEAEVQYLLGAIQNVSSPEGRRAREAFQLQQSFKERRQQIAEEERQKKLEAIAEYYRDEIEDLRRAGVPAKDIVLPEEIPQIPCMRWAAMPSMYDYGVMVRQSDGTAVPFKPEDYCDRVSLARGDIRPKRATLLGGEDIATEITATADRAGSSGNGHRESPSTIPAEAQGED